MNSSQNSSSHADDEPEQAGGKDFEQSQRDDNPRHQKEAAAAPEEVVDAVLDTKKQVPLGRVLENLIASPHLKQPKRICYKIVQSEVYVTIHARSFKIKGKLHYIFTFEDVSSHRRYLKHQEAKKHNMIQLASIVHDLKTPLNCIQGTINIIKLLVEQQPGLVQYMKNINRSFEFIFSMIEDIQDLAQFNNN
jgi:signal transduction histidine kinase